MACTGTRASGIKDVGAIEAAPASTVCKGKAGETIAPVLGAGASKDIGATGFETQRFWTWPVRTGPRALVCKDVGAIIEAAPAITVGKGKAGETIAPVLGAGAS